MRVFPSQDTVGKLIFLRDRLEDILESFIANKVDIIALPEAGGYTFENGSSTAVFFCVLTARFYLKDKYFRR
jgi:hypothetical protein